MPAMICTVCGAQMNEHGEKLIYAEQRNGVEIVEELTEAHTCPNCGHNDARVAAL